MRRQAEDRAAWVSRRSVGATRLIARLTST
jgi:hypothetical protein